MQKIHENGIRFLVGAIIKFEYLIFCIQFHTLREVVLVRERKIFNRFSIQADIRYVYNDLNSCKFKADQLPFFYEADVKELVVIYFLQCLVKSIRAQTFRERFMYIIV